jgi:restriction endonuclease S subunit
MWYSQIDKVDNLQSGTNSHSYSIIIPSLSIQNKIDRILYSFIELTSCKKQHEYEFDWYLKFSE